MGRVLRTTLPTSQGGVVHLFVVYCFQGAEEDAEQLRLTDHLLQAVLAEAQVVCVGQPMLIAGDLNADPGVIPCLAKGISAGRYVDLALAYSRVTCRFNREEGTGSRSDFFVGCPGALAASRACYVTDRWFTLHSSLIARFHIGAWMADVACPTACQPIWPACWLDTPDRSSSSSTRVVQDVWDVNREELDAVSRSSVDDFWSIWRKMRRQVCLGHMLLLEVLLLLAALPFLVEVCYGFVAGVWEAELLVVRFRAGCIGSVMMMMLISIVLNSLSTLLFLLCYSLVGVSTLLLMFLRALRIRVLLNLDGMP